MRNQKLFIIAIAAVLLLLSGFDAVAGTKSKQGATLGKGYVTFESQLSKISNHEFYVTNYGLYGQSPAGGSAGWFWPRQSNRAYIYGAGPWFGAKTKVPGSNELAKMVTVGYNPNSGAAWFTPGSVDDGDAGLDESDPRSSKYILYRSIDYDANGKNVANPSKADWPIRWATPEKTPGKDGYFGEYVADPAERAQYKPVYISQEDIFCVYKDTDIKRNPEYKANSGYPLRIEIEQTIYSWGFGPYKDFVFFVYNVKNKGADTLRECYLAPAMDPDIGTADNDHNSFYLKDSSLNLAFQYTETEVGYPGILGFDFLESPRIKTSEDSAHYRNVTGRVRNVGDQLGLTTFRNWIIENDPAGATARYDFMAANVRDGDLSAGDKRLLLATGPFTMLPGDTARVVICAMIAPGVGSVQAGSVESTPFLDSLVNLDIFAQSVYDNNFAAPRPPDPSRISGNGIDRGVAVTWDGTSELSEDTLTAGGDFWGYRLYRSRSPQGPWKLLLDTNMATAAGQPASSWMPHSFIDGGKDTTGGLVNNIDYYYWIASYDQGDPLNNIPSLENTPVANVNVVKVVPAGPPAGLNSSFSSFTTAQNLGSFRNWRVVPTNQKRFNQLFSGHPLAITLTPVNNGINYTLNVSLKDSIGGYQTAFIINPGLSVAPAELAGDTTITNLYQSVELFNAFKLLVDYSIIQRKEAVMFDTSSVMQGNSTTAVVRLSNPPVLTTENLGEAVFSIDFTTGGVERIGLSAVDSVDVPYLNMIVRNVSTGELWDTTRNNATSAVYGKWFMNTAFFKSTAGTRLHRRAPFASNRYYLAKAYGVNNADTLLPVHNFSIIGQRIAIDPFDLGRMINFPASRQWQSVPPTTQDFQVGNQLTVRFRGGIAGTLGASAFPSPNVKLHAQASTSTPAKYTEDMLKQIRIVPNPYFVSHKAQVTTDVPRLFFNNLPPQCTIRIYNVAGDLIKVINHSGGSRAEWDLLSDGRQKVASQLLLAYVEIPDGTSTILKFSVIVGGFRSIREN